MEQVVVEFKNISKVFGGNKVIDNISLQIKQGSFVTLLGPSGCGKTTLLRMLAGFYEPDQGEILINGSRVDNLPPYSRNTAMVFQEYALFPHMTVYENVAYGLQVRKEKNEDISKKVEETLHLMQLDGLSSRYPNQLSGGQQQRVAVARALVMNPVALLLDEPLSNLDAKLRESVRVELRLIQQQLGLTMIYVTHDQQEALAMSDMVVVIQKGIVHQYGKPKEIYFKPQTRFVADFIGTTNFIEDVVVKNIADGLVTVDCKGQKLNLHSDELVQPGHIAIISIRPESIVLAKQSSSNCLQLQGIIKHVMFLGEKVRYFIQDKYEKDWIVDSFDSGREILEGEVYLQIDSAKAHLIYEK